MKPPGMSSSDVVGDIRRLFQEKRVGHLGTLDPGAAGVLPGRVGRAVRLFDYLVDKEKTYRFELLFGRETDTQDVYGRVTDRTEKNLSRQELEGLLPRFRGEIIQQAPAYSALKSGGKKLYELARKGQSVERTPRKITVSSIEIIGREGGDYLLKIACSKGTYVRTLCNDIGASLGCGACMSSLRRISAGAFSIEDAHSIDEVENAANDGRMVDIMLPVDTLFSALPELKVPESAAKRLKTGNIIKISAHDCDYRVYSESGEFLLVGKAENGKLKTIKSFFEVSQ